MPKLDCDVLILGAGPAGCATALSLRAHAPALKIVLLGGGVTPQAVGEVLPALARPLLGHLGLWPDFVDAGFLPAHASAAAWGRREVVENHFIHSARGHGWHLDRARFDALLQARTAAAGGELLAGQRPRAIVRAPGGWLATLDDDARIAARFVVDASGRQAVLARLLGLERQRADKLAAYLAYLPDGRDGDPRTLIEARPDGWWYTAPLPGGRRVVGCQTDADLGRQAGLQKVENWLDALAATDWIGQAMGKDAGAGWLAPPAGIWVRPAGTARVAQVCDDDWLAVGDAAISFDPLSSQGISKALRGGIFAAYAIADRLLRNDGQGLLRYQTLLEVEFADYQAAYADYYGRERRWPDAPFWRRRLVAQARASAS